MVLQLLMVLATSTVPTTPAISFTSDSVYTNNTFVTTTVTQEEDSSYTLHIEKEPTLGYCIFDNADTPYIEGVKLDDEFITDWVIPNYDPNVAHTLLVKTVYTDDIAGMLAAASKGDFTKMLSNPVMLFQLVYYVLAVCSIIFGSVGIFKSRKLKAKSSAQIAEEVSNTANLSFTKMENVVSDIFTSSIIPVIQQVQKQNNNILEALIISKGTDADSHLALIDLLKNTSSNTDLEKLADKIKTQIKDSVTKNTQAKQAALEEVNQIVKDTSKKEDPSSKDTYGGISI